jgi:hypothetical protein
MRTSVILASFHNLITAILFVGLSAAIWMTVSEFDVARIEGFDPYRYEYYARTTLPEYLAGSSSYRIVLLLDLIYQYLPYYIGFIVFIGFCLFFVLNAGDRVDFRYAVLSPLTFYYIAQTGKDGLSILAIICVALFASKRLLIWATPLIVVTSVALYIRPALILFLPLIFMAVRYDIFKATIFSFVMAAVFLIAEVGKDAVYILQDVAANEQTGILSQLGRELTFGYSLIAVIGRLFLLLISPFIQPLSALLKFSSSSEAFILFEGVCQLVFLILLIHKRIVLLFMLNSIPFAIIVAASSPFYHFRYMAILYPAIFMISVFKKRHIRNKILY